MEMLRALRTARQTAVQARTQAINARKGLQVTAPAELREQLAGLPTARLVRAAAALEPGTLATPTAAARLALRGLARRYQYLDAEITLLTEQLDALTARHAPALRGLHGVGPDCAAALLVAAGDNPRRLHSEAAFAALCGTSPVEASSGKTRRHRLNRGGDRQANAALHRIVVVRLRWHQPPATTPPGAPPRARPTKRSFVASSATWPERSSPCSARSTTPAWPVLLDLYRSVRNRPWPP